MNAKQALLAALAISLAAALASACKRSRPRRGELAPLNAASWRTALDVPGFLPAEVAVPLGARTARPILIAIHGDADRPEWQCGSYRGVVKSRAFVLCPRGAPRSDDRFTLGTESETRAELRAALQQLKSRFGAHVARGDVLLAGLGPGVEHVFALALEEPKFFARLVLVDGSTRSLTPAVATRFGQRGGRRVLALCTPGACDADVEDRLRALHPTGVETRLVRLQTGRGLDASVTSRLLEEWSWLVSDDPRWG